MPGQSVEHVALAPKNIGILPQADCTGRAGQAGHGPYIIIFLRLDEDLVADASFQTYGCPAAVACGSKLTEWVKGKTAEEAAGITEEQVRSWFDKFPNGKRHCARIAAKALHDAVACYNNVPANKEQFE